MKFCIKKIYIILILAILIQPRVFARDNKDIYTRENISNYFLGIISAKKYDDENAHKYLKKVQLLKNHHSRYNVEFINNLVLLGKFDKALAFSEARAAVPVIMAPACPIRFPVGAVTPAMKATTGFVMCCSIHLAQSSSSVPPISPHITTASVAESSLKRAMMSRCLRPLIGSPPIPTHVDCPRPTLDSWSTTS